jgi:hypothetical protein
MNNPDIPVQDILLRYAGSFPISDDAVFNIIEQLEMARELPGHLCPQASRYAVRVICALLPELDRARPEDALTICGLDHLNKYGIADKLVNGEGPWAGEIGPLRIRDLLLSVQAGEHPDDASARIQVSEQDLLHLNHLLSLPEYWHEEILTNVLAIRLAGGSWLQIARFLGTKRPGVIWSWIREAKRFERNLRAARA